MVKRYQFVFHFTGWWWRWPRYRMSLIIDTPRKNLIELERLSISDYGKTNHLIILPNII